MIDSSCGSRGEILRRIGLARTCMQQLEKRIWKSGIRLDTKIRLYQTYIAPVVLYGCETWTTTKYLCARLDAFDMWALRKILRISYTRHITNDEVRSRSNCQPLSSIVTSRRLRFFGHIARRSPDEDHHRAIAAAIRKPPPDWRRPAGRPSYTWLRSVEADLRPLTSEHWSFFCMEKSFWAGGLAPHRGHGYALEEYAIRRRMMNGRVTNEAKK